MPVGLGGLLSSWCGFVSRMFNVQSTYPQGTRYPHEKAFQSLNKALLAISCSLNKALRLYFSLGVPGTLHGGRLTAHDYYFIYPLPWKLNKFSHCKK